MPLSLPRRVTATSAEVRRCFGLKLVLGIVGLALAAVGTAEAQQLLTLGPELEGPSLPGRSVGVSSPVTVGGGPHFAQVDLDLVRSAPRWLELPTPDGRVLTAERSVFEDRGEGDVMWSGRFPGASHDSVVLTIAEGGLGGHFGEPLGAKYRIGAGTDGGGRMVDTLGLSGQAPQRCGLGGEADGRLHEHLTELLSANRRPRDELQRVASAQSDDELKILVLYTASAERTWNDPDGVYYAGGRAATLQLAADYLAMVFRNGDLGLVPRVVFERAPAWVNEVGRSVSRFQSDVFHRFSTSGEIALLRRRRDADQVHLFYGQDVRALFYGGRAHLYGSMAVSFLGLPDIFAHETGHNLGGWHQPGVSEPLRAHRRRNS